MYNLLNKFQHYSYIHVHVQLRQTYKLVETTQSFLQCNRCTKNTLPAVLMSKTGVLIGASMNMACEMYIPYKQWHLRHCMVGHCM